MTSNPGIYRVDGPGGKIYVGSAKNIGVRWKGHVRDLRKGEHANPKLQAAWNFHGEESFVFTVIELVHDKCQLLDREQFWIDSTEAAIIGYNILLVANSRLGLKATEATKRKQSNAHMGRKHGPMSAEQKAYYSQLYKGKSLSDETRAKMSEARKGRVFSDETKAKMAAAKKGRKFSDQHRASLAAAKVGKKQTPEHVANRMAGMKRSQLVNSEHSAQM